MLKISNLDNLIILLMFALLPVDMLNGAVLKNGINLPISISQLYKLLILVFLFFRFLFKPKLLLFSLGFTFVLLIPSLYQSIKSQSVGFLFEDIIKISKYLAPLFSFLFFVDYIKRTDELGIRKLIRLVQFSYFILAGNILLKYIGLGYPMYEFGNIGSKGFFYAGNEISVLLVILSCIIAFDLWYNKKRIQYFLFWALTLFIGLTISSKTGVVGIALVFLLIPLKRPSIKLNLGRMMFFLSALFLVLPLALYLSWKFIQGTAFYIRLQYFSTKFDFWTFLLSNRNVFFSNTYKTYKDEYSLIEKIIGMGQSQYELINSGNIVEVDFADIFFAYGIVGLFYFLAIILFLIVQAMRFSKNNKYIFANFVLLMTLVLLAISTTAGHVFSSGMAAVFTGMLLSLMYFKKNIEI